MAPAPWRSCRIPRVYATPNASSPCTSGPAGSHPVAATMSSYNDGAKCRSSRTPTKRCTSSGSAASAALSSGASRPAAPLSLRARSPVPGLPSPLSVRTTHSPSLWRWWNGYAGVVRRAGPNSASNRRRSDSTSEYRSDSAAPRWNRANAYSNNRGLCGARSPPLAHWRNELKLLTHCVDDASTSAGYRYGTRRSPPIRAPLCCPSPLRGRPSLPPHGRDNDRTDATTNAGTGGPPPTGPLGRRSTPRPGHTVPGNPFPAAHFCRGRSLNPPAGVR